MRSQPYAYAFSRASPVASALSRRCRTKTPVFFQCRKSRACHVVGAGTASPGAIVFTFGLRLCRDHGDRLGPILQHVNQMLQMIRGILESTALGLEVDKRIGVFITPIMASSFSPSRRVMSVESSPFDAGVSPDAGRSASTKKMVFQMRT